MVGRPGLPADPIALNVKHYLWLVEDIIRDRNLFEKGGESLDKLYAEAERRHRDETAPAVSDSARALAAQQMLSLRGM